MRAVIGLAAAMIATAAFAGEIRIDGSGNTVAIDSIGNGIITLNQRGGNNLVIGGSSGSNYDLTIIRSQPKPGEVCRQVVADPQTMTTQACFTPFLGYACPEGDGPCRKIGGQPTACPLPPPSTSWVCAPASMFMVQE